MANKFLIISIFTLGLFILIGSFVIANSVKQLGLQTSSQIEQKKELLSQSDLADYLGITDTELSKLLSIEDNAGPGEIGITSIKIDGKIYYPRRAVDEWLLTGYGTYRKSTEE